MSAFPTTSSRSNASRWSCSPRPTISISSHHASSAATTRTGARWATAHRASAWANGLRTIQHELTHHFVVFYYPQAPLWLNEGLASYYATLAIEEGYVILGRNDPARQRWVQSSKGPSVAEILATSAASVYA